MTLRSHPCSRVKDGATCERRRRPARDRVRQRRERPVQPLSVEEARALVLGQQRGELVDHHLRRRSEALSRGDPATQRVSAARRLDLV